MSDRLSLIGSAPLLRIPIKTMEGMLVNYSPEEKGEMGRGTGSQWIAGHCQIEGHEFVIRFPIGELRHQPLEQIFRRVLTGLRDSLIKLFEPQ